VYCRLVVEEVVDVRRRTDASLLVAVVELWEAA
jgi:hypothetical protein